MIKSKYKRLAIISDCIHMMDTSGRVVTENHIYCRQMEALAAHFEQTIIVCPFVSQKADSVTTAYTLPSLQFYPLPDAGGNTWRDKLNIFKTIPAWIQAFAKAYKHADVFYLRMPNNLNIPGFFYFHYKQAVTFATYTGTWDNYAAEPGTYRFQKWLLKSFFKGPVWVYINEEKRGTNLFKSFSPSFSEAEWNAETVQVAERKKLYNTQGIAIPVFITVGALVPNKNQQLILEVCKQLKQQQFPFYWYIVGDGFMRTAYEQFVADNNLQDVVCIAGKKTYPQLQQLYRKANFMVQATLVEGFGKAPVEAMCHGVIPVLSATAMAGEMTGKGTRGFVFDGSNAQQLLQLIIGLTDHSNHFAGMIENGRQYVKGQTLENWATAITHEVNNFTA